MRIIHGATDKNHMATAYIGKAMVGLSIREPLDCCIGIGRWQAECAGNALR
jgi:hypothetical protein